MTASQDAYKRGYDQIEWKPLPPMAAKPLAESKRADFPIPFAISDCMEPTEHIDGKHYTSKSQFRAVTKAHGCVEVGNDPARLRKIERPKLDRKARHEAIAKAIAQSNL